MSTNCVVPPISFSLKNLQEYSMADKLGALSGSGTININKTSTPYAFNSIEITVASSTVEIMVNNEKKPYTVNRVVNISAARFTNLQTLTSTEPQVVSLGGSEEKVKSNETVKKIMIPAEKSDTRVIYDLELLFGCKVGNNIFLSANYLSGINVRYYDLLDPYTLKETGITPITVNPTDILKRHSILLHDYPYNFVGKILNKINLSYDDYGIGFPADNWEVASLKIDDSSIKFTNEDKIVQFMNTVKKCANWSWVNDTVANKVAVQIADITSVAPNGNSNYTINTKMPYGITVNTGERIWFSLVFFKSFKCVQKSGNDYTSEYSAGVVYGFENQGYDIPKTGTVDISKLPELYIPNDPYIKGRYSPYCDADRCQSDKECGGLTPYCYNGKCANCVVDRNCPVDMYCTPESNICASTKQCQIDDDCKTLGLKYCVDSSHGKRCGNCRNNRNEDCKEFGTDFECGIDNMCSRTESNIKQCDKISQTGCPSNSTCNDDNICVNNDECVDNGDCYCGYACKNGKWVERPLPDECYSDVECPVGLVCNGNKCSTQYTTARSQRDCNDKTVFMDGQCIPAISLCSRDDECLNGTVCISNHCQLPRPIKISKISLLFGDFLFWIIILFFILSFMVYKLFT